MPHPDAKAPPEGSLRERCLQRLADLADADVLIIGGGVNGVGVLRDLALNGVSAVLIDRHDFCQGATAASTRMAHGGLRYLENREFSLVAESNRERNLLLKHAPHVTKPLEVVVPLRHYARGFAGSVLRFLGLSRRKGPINLLALKGALLLYEFLGRVERQLPRSRIALTRRRLPPGLADTCKATVTYYDGRLDNPEGLVMEMLEEALDVSERVSALNHMQWNIMADGGFELIEQRSDDRQSGSRYRLKPRVVVNATGAWVDQVNRRLGLGSDHVLPVKGAHLVLRHAELQTRIGDRAYYFDDGSGRFLICCGLSGSVLMGTTEEPVTDPNDNAVSHGEVEYLLEGISFLFDDIEVTRDHIVALTSGIRPLQRSSGGDAYRANRDHALFSDDTAHGWPVISLVGGKWTTFRSFAEQASDRVLACLERQRSLSTRDRVYPGAVGWVEPDGGAHAPSGLPRRTTGQRYATPAHLVAACAEASGLPPARCHVLVTRYGAIALRVARHCAAVGDDALLTLPDYSVAEIGWVVRCRAVHRVDDFLLRRSRIVLEGELSEAVLREVAPIVADSLGHRHRWAEREIERCLALPTLFVKRARAAA